MTSRVLGVRLHLLTGKGGVGKTTLAAALAVEAVRRGGRPIVVELGHGSSVGRALGSDRGIGYEPVELSPGLFAANVELDHALTDYLARRIRSRAAARRITASPALRSFFDAAPAVAELLALERIEALLGRFDPVLVDLDATGHALMFLELPRLLASIAPRGPIGELVRGLGALLEDEERTRLHIVTLPSRLPLEETLELHTELSLTAVPIGAAFVNRSRPRPLPLGTDADAEALEARLAAEPSVVEAREALALARRAARAHDAAEVVLAELSARGVRCVALPDLDPLDSRTGGPSGLAALGRLAAEGLR